MLFKLSLIVYNNIVFYIFLLYAGYSFSQYSFFIGGQQNLNAPIIIDRYNCIGSETTLSDCAAFDYAT